LNFEFDFPRLAVPVAIVISRLISIEAFRYASLGAGSINPAHLLYCVAVTVVILFLGILLCNHVERTYGYGLMAKGAESRVRSALKPVLGVKYAVHSHITRCCMQCGRMAGSFEELRI